jgi:hypothetical protein
LTRTQLATTALSGKDFENNRLSVKYGDKTYIIVKETQGGITTIKLKYPDGTAVKDSNGRDIEVDTTLGLTSGVQLALASIATYKQGGILKYSNPAGEI